MDSSRASLTRFAWLSIAAALLTIGLKTCAYLFTGSVGLLSDALESVVNLVAACVALAVLIVAARPADDGHPFGHDKAEYFSSGVEGSLIVIAAISIAVAAIERLLHPRGLEQVGFGLAISALASAVNFIIARILLTAARRHDSIVLEADAHHLQTDVWTSAGIIVGVGAVALTGLDWLDPAIALLVALGIVRTGAKLVRRSVLGLMDTALPADEQKIIVDILESHRGEGMDYHALRTRSAASRRFVTVHILVPGAWTIQRGHDLLERIEGEIRAQLAHTTITTHIEPLEDPASWRDLELERPPSPSR